MYKTIRLLISKHKQGLGYTFVIIVVVALLSPFAVSLLSSVLEDTNSFKSGTFVKSIVFFIIILEIFMKIVNQLVLASVIALGLAACSNSSTDTPSADTANAGQVEQNSGTAVAPVAPSSTTAM